MNKGWKIALYVALLLAIIAVVWLMFGNTNPSVEIPDIEDTEVPVEEISDSGDNRFTYGNSGSFEKDVMEDLEGFFGNNNGYEDVEGEYGFTSTEAE